MFDLTGSAIKKIRLPIESGEIQTQVVFAQSGDINSRVLAATICDDEGVLSLEKYTDAILVATLANNDVEVVDGVVFGNQIFCKLSDLILAEEGLVVCNIVLHGKDLNDEPMQLTSSAFQIVINRTPKPLGSTDETSLLVQVLLRLAEFEEEIAPALALIKELPSIPTKVSQLENDSAFITFEQASDVLDEHTIDNLDTAEAGIGVLDARQGKILADMLIGSATLLENRLDGNEQKTTFERLSSAVNKMILEWRDSEDAYCRGVYAENLSMHLQTAQDRVTPGGLFDKGGIPFLYGITGALGEMLLLNDLELVSPKLTNNEIDQIAEINYLIEEIVAEATEGTHDS